MFFCRSISHHDAPLTLREQLSLTVEQQTSWLSHLDKTEAVILSTCNRLELYANVPDESQLEALWQSLLLLTPVNGETAADYAVTYAGRAVARHLFRVASGLESMALGEVQILGQVSDAYEQAIGVAGQSLSLLFRSAIHTAKRVHAETAIGVGASSVSSLGVARAESALGALSERTVLVVGAGEMARSLLKALTWRGARAVTVLSRTYERAQQLAAAYGFAAQDFAALRDLLATTDLLFTASSAQTTLLNRDDIAPLMAHRPAHPLCIVDIAVPRDVAADVAQIDGVLLYDMDALAHVVADYQEERHNSLPIVEQMIAEALDAFWADYQGRSAGSAIQQLRERAEQIRQAELSRLYKRLSPENDAARDLVDQFSSRFMNKMLHQIIVELKASAVEAQIDDVA